MIISHFELYRYTLALKESVKIKGKVLNKREGIILRLQSPGGSEGLGEIAPLPEFNQETIEACVGQLNKILPMIKSQEIPSHLENLNGGFEHWLGHYQLYPSVRFGIEMAILNLVADLKKVPLQRLFYTEPLKEIKVTGLLQGSAKDMEAQAKKMIKEGFTDFKMKVDRDIKESVKKIKAINDIIFEKGILHIDANQYLTVEDAITLGEEIGAAAVTYIEDPFKEPDQMPHFFNQTLIPVAIDEPVKDMSFDQIKSIEGVDFIVIKPGVFGGIERTKKWIEEAKKVALRIVISSAYESDLTIYTLANLSGLCEHDTAAGLDTLKYFKESLLQEPLSIKKGQISLNRGPIHLKDLNNQVLTLITHAKH